MSLRGAYRGGDTKARAGWWLAFTYDPDVIERLKNAVPHRDRVWDTERSEWWVAEQYEPQILELFPAFAAYLAQGQLL